MYTNLRCDRMTGRYCNGFPLDTISTDVLPYELYFIELKTAIDFEKRLREAVP